MARIVDYLSVEELGLRYRQSADVCPARHFRRSGFLAQGRTFSDMASTTGLAQRWLEQLARRYNEYGPEALGDRRRGNGAPARILTPGAASASCRSAAGRWGVDDAEDRGVDGAGVGLDLGVCAMRLECVAGDRLDDPEAAPEEPEVGEARRSRRL